MKSKFLNTSHFDKFQFFKKQFIENENHPMMTFTHDGEELQYDIYTYQFYLFYIKRFGMEFIEYQINKINKAELKSRLQQYLIYTSNYITYEKDNFLNFCENLSIRTNIKELLKEYIPFETTNILADILSKSQKDKDVYELSSILIAYFFENSGATEQFENYWFYFSKIFTDIYGTNQGIEICDKIFKRANKLLIDYGSDCVIPSQPYEYPEPLTYNMSTDEFQKEQFEISMPKHTSGHDHVHIDKQIFFKDYMQAFPFYAGLRNTKGKEIFEDRTMFNHPILLKHLEVYSYIYENYYENECQRFKDYLNMLGCEFLYDKLSSFVPVSYPSINKFIKKNYKENDYEDSFERYTSILLIYWLYDKEDLAYSNTTYVHKLLQNSIEQSDDAPKDTTFYRDDWASIRTNSIIEYANKYGEKMNMPLIPKVTIQDGKIKKNGTFNLPWEYVSFQNGYMLLSHPLHTENKNNKPFKLTHISSKVSYNKIKLYFTSNVPLLKVISKKGNITGIDKESVFNLDDYISAIINRTSSKRIKFEIKRKEHKDSKIKSYTLSEVNNLPLVKKSYYLNELCKLHLSSYKVYNFDELRVNSSSFSEESVFCFIIKDNKGQLLLAVENTLESRSTILFLIKKTQLHKALDSINVFFSSSEINKRQSLLWKEVDFKDPSIIRYERIIHTSFGEWNRDIKRFL